MNASDWMEKVANAFYDIEGVEWVYVTQQGEYIKGDAIFDFWVIINERNLDLVREIAEAKYNLLKLAPIHEDSVYRVSYVCDYHTIYRDGRDLKDIEPSFALILTKP